MPATSLREKCVEKAMARMTPPLRIVQKALADQLGRADSENCLARYACGEIVLSVMQDEAKYRKGAVRLLAVSLGKSDDTLYNMARVAAAWDRGTFAAMAKRLTMAGTPLSFLHFVLIARVDAPAKRAHLLELAYTDALTAEELRRYVAGTKKSAKDKADPGQQLLEQTAGSASRLAAWLDGTGRAFGTSPGDRRAAAAACDAYLNVARTLLARLGIDVELPAQIADQLTVLKRGSGKSESVRKSVAVLFGGERAG